MDIPAVGFGGGMHVVGCRICCCTDRALQHERQNEISFGKVISTIYLCSPSFPFGFTVLFHHYSSFFMMRFVSLIVVIVYCSALSSLQAQQPVSTTASMVSLSVSSPFAERTAFSATSPQPVFIIATRSNTSGAALVLLDVQYRSLDGQPFSNTELQEDWGTSMLSLNNMGTFTNFIFLDQGQAQGAIALTPGRVNFRKNADRILSIRLLPPRPNTGQAYVINPSTTQNTVTIALRDNFTAPTQPYILNAIQNAVMTSGSVSLIEIETPSLRSDGLPSRVFVNERGSPLFYSTTSFQPNLVRAEIITGEVRPSKLSALRLTAVAPGRANVILVAVDSSNRAATSAFEVLVRQAPAAVSVRSSSDESIEVFPNPASEAVWLKGMSIGAVCTLYSTQGQALRQMMIRQTEEVFSLQDLPQGAYLLVIEQNGRRSIRPLLKQ